MITQSRQSIHRFLNTNTASVDYRTPVLLRAQALNAAAAARTVTLPTSRLGSITAHRTLQIDVDFTRVAATNLTCAVTASYDEGVSFGNTKSGSVSGGAETLATYSVSNPTGATEHFTFTVGVDGATDVKLVFDGASAGASDTITVRITGVS